MTYTVEQIAGALGLEAVGASSLSVTRVAEPAQAGPDDLALAMKPAFAEGLTQGRARAAMLWAEADWQGFGLEAAILAPRPRYAMAGLSAMMDPGQGFSPGIHPSAVIDPTAELGAEVSVGPFTTIGAKVRVGVGCVIGPHCYIGADSILGAGALVHPGVRIMARVRIGERFVAQPGAVIGGDGFSFVTAEASGVERARETLGASGTQTQQAWARIHSLGGVSIGDDVEIGSNSTVDRGTVRDTVIGSGTKIDNLVQVGHNVVIGPDCLLCAQSGVAGSTVLGRNVVLGGHTGVSDNITIGDNVITGGGTKILSKVPAGQVMLGYPATKMDAQIEIYKALRRLPRLMRDVATLKAAGKTGVSNRDASD